MSSKSISSFKQLLYLLNQLSGGRLVKVYDSWFTANSSRPTNAIVAAYLNKTNVRKLNIGCGINILPGWLNTDIKLRKDLDLGGESYAQLDATKPFEIPNDTFDFIFSEHMIEHIPYTSALHMVKECYRILRPGGKIRITTPNLAFLIDLYSEHKTETQKEYIEWSYSKFCPPQMPAIDASVINNFFYSWGHSFIYDKKSISHLLSSAGFTEISFHKPQISNVPEFMDLEKHGTPDGIFNKNIPQKFNLLESLTVEATKV
jgi:predicted SAM-dependent methyltransferase